MKYKCIVCVPFVQRPPFHAIARSNSLICENRKNNQRDTVDLVYDEYMDMDIADKFRATKLWCAIYQPT